VGTSDDGIKGLGEGISTVMRIWDTEREVKARGAHLSKNAKGGAASVVKTHD